MSGRHFERDVIDRFLAQLGAALGDFRPEVPPPSVAPADRAIVWVVGTPRSGTTLMAETLAAAADVGYVDNVAARFPQQPEVGMLLSASLAAATAGARGADDDTFEIGRTRGPRGTHEFGFFWTRMLGLTDAAPHRLDDAARARVDEDALRIELHRMVAVADRPFLVRNVICGLNAAVLARVHPRSVFVEMRREPAPTAASILDCRRRHAGGSRGWWSLRPSTWTPSAPPPPGEPTDHDPDPQAAAEVARQVVDLHRDLEGEQARVERDTPARWRRVDYAALCRDPAGVLGTVAEDVAALGDRLDLRLDGVRSREVRPGPGMHADERAAIAAVLDASS